MILTKHKVNVRRDGTDVILSIDGKPVLGADNRNMERVARTILMHCQKAQEEERALVLARQKAATS